jgi:hypothetical protein
MVEWRYSSIIIDLGTRSSGQLTPLSLYPWIKNTRYLLDRRLGGLQSRNGTFGKEKNILPLPEIEPGLPSP